MASAVACGGFVVVLRQRVPGGGRVEPPCPSKTRHRRWAVRPQLGSLGPRTDDESSDRRKGSHARGTGRGAHAKAMRKSGQPSKRVSFQAEVADFSRELPQGGGGGGDDSEDKPVVDDHHFITANAAAIAPITNVSYKKPHERSSIALAPPTGSLTKPNHEDILRRVAIVIHQHILKCEHLYQQATPETLESGNFHLSKMKKFSEENYVSPKHVYQFVRIPVTRMGFSYGIRQLEVVHNMPTAAEVYSFLYELFDKADLSDECGIVCLIYVERLMEMGNVPLVASTWRPCVLCGLLLASKVWQDIGSWNCEISEVYPEFSIKSVNRLEKDFCHEIKWNLYISSSIYAKYYFALRSKDGKQDFRRKYNAMLMTKNEGSAIEEKSSILDKEKREDLMLSRSF